MPVWGELAHKKTVEITRLFERKFGPHTGPLRAGGTGYIPSCRKARKICRFLLGASWICVFFWNQETHLVGKACFHGLRPQRHPSMKPDQHPGIRVRPRSSPGLNSEVQNSQLPPASRACIAWLSCHVRNSGSGGPDCVWCLSQSNQPPTWALSRQPLTDRCHESSAGFWWR